jgi:CRP-like cAMP-binding protein
MLQKGAAVAYAKEEPCENNLLRMLRPEEFDLLRPSLESFDMDRGTVLHEPGDQVEHAFFPCGGALASYVVVLGSGASVETALIGREGAIGGIVSQGHVPAYSRAVAVIGGEFLRIDLNALEEAKTRSLRVRHLFARYADCLLAQIFQSVACNAAHKIEQRAVRWLVTAMDHTGDHEVPLTQEQLASMLGVGRSYVSRVIQILKQQGVLATRRGGLIVMDAEKLASLSCGCHDAVRRHFEEVLGGVYPKSTTGGPLGDD